MCVLDTSVCWVQEVCVRYKCVLDASVLGYMCVSATSVCWIHVCVGYKCVLDTPVCRGQVCVGDINSRLHVSRFYTNRTKKSLRA